MLLSKIGKYEYLVLSLLLIILLSFFFLKKGKQPQGIQIVHSIYSYIENNLRLLRVLVIIERAITLSLQLA
jgi:hypothetical protein